MEVQKARIHAAYTGHCKAHGERHPKHESVFPRAWKKYAPSITHRRPGGGTMPWHWQFHPLDHHRAEFQKAMNIAEWDWPPHDSTGEDELR